VRWIIFVQLSYIFEHILTPGKSSIDRQSLPVVKKRYASVSLVDLWISSLQPMKHWIPS
jgi:hypothetical protein